jgi:hypothetical protein
LTAASAVVGALSLCTVGFAGAEPGFSPVQAMPVPNGNLGNDSTYGSVSCPSTTSCTAVGVTGSGVPIVVTEASGAWGAPQTIALPVGGGGGSLGVSCPSVGDCLAAGGYTTSAGATSPLLVAESSGTWGAATTATPPADALTGAAEDATFATPWCASAGNCEAVGAYRVTATTARLMTAVETAGTWGTVAAVPGGTQTYGNFLPSVRFGCTAVGSCVVVTDQSAWVETGGTWGARTDLALGPHEAFAPGGVACPSTATCVAVGTRVDSSCYCRPSFSTASVTETSGTWSAPEEIPRGGGESGLSGIACEPTVCLAVGNAGSYNDFDTYTDPIAFTWSNGTWSSIGTQLITPGPQETDASWFDDVACASATQCLAVGRDGYFDASGGPSLRFPYSSVLIPVRSIVAPGPPTALSATPMLHGANVSFGYPLDDGGAPITSFTATASPGGSSCTTAGDTCAITGLVDGRQYVVSATDSNGTASSQPTLSSHFFAGQPPDVPSHVRVEAGGGRASISWQASSSPSGEPVLRYLVRLQGQQHPVCVTRMDRCTLRGLVHGFVYVTAITAINVTGASGPFVLRFVAK